LAWGEHMPSQGRSSANANAATGVRVPPPVLYLVALAAGITLDHLWPPPFSLGLLRYVGSILVIASFAIMPPVLRRFRRAGTPFDVRKPATALITDGPYRFSRNPTYLSLTLLYVGVGALLDSAWTLILVVPLLVAMDRWIVMREERHLEARFGEQYRRYKSTVRRWL